MRTPVLSHDQEDNPRMGRWARLVLPQPSSHAASSSKWRKGMTSKVLRCVLTGFAFLGTPASEWPSGLNIDIDPAVLESKPPADPPYFNAP
jgi:hypothetical protein